MGVFCLFTFCLILIQRGFCACQNMTPAILSRSGYADKSMTRENFKIYCWEILILLYVQPSEKNLVKHQRLVLQYSFILTEKKTHDSGALFTVCHFH